MNQNISFFDPKPYLIGHKDNLISELLTSRPVYGETVSIVNNMTAIVQHNLQSIVAAVAYTIYAKHRLPDYDNLQGDHKIIFNEAEKLLVDLTNLYNRAETFMEGNSVQYVTLKLIRAITLDHNEFRRIKVMRQYNRQLPETAIDINYFINLKAILTQQDFITPEIMI
jgi:hypothetical protein